MKAKRSGRARDVRAWLVLLFLCVCAGCGGGPKGQTALPEAASAPRQVEASAPAPVDAGPGFTSRRSLEEHYEKHGAEFGSISQAEYLALARELRDAPAAGNILEEVRSDGIVTRFDKKRGYFGAFNRDRTIRTFFVPNDGIRYFYRQAKRRN